MARFNEILSGRLNRGLQKLLSMKGEPPAPQLASEITPVLPLPLGHEYRYLEGWETFGAFVGVAAVAAQVGSVQLRNPVKSGVIAVVERVVFVNQSGTDTGALAAGRPPTVFVDGGTSGNIRGLDARTRDTGTCIITGTTAAAFPPAGTTKVLSFPQITNGAIDFLTDPSQEIALLPGCVLIAGSASANTTITVSMRWRERPIEDSEVT